jgi:putative ABC transport system substrate-binding protein
LSESGFEEGRNVAIDYRWAEDKFDRLPELANQLVRRNVAVLVMSGSVH